MFRATFDFYFHSRRDGCLLRACASPTALCAAKYRPIDSTTVRSSHPEQHHGWLFRPSAIPSKDSFSSSRIPASCPRNLRDIRAVFESTHHHSLPVFITRLYLIAKFPRTVLIYRPTLNKVARIDSFLSMNDIAIL